MPTETSIAEPFDRAARRRRRDRAAAAFAAHDFLKAALVDDLTARIAGFERRFAAVLDLGSHAGAFAGAGEFVVALDAAETFARAAASPAVVAGLSGSVGEDYSRSVVAEYSRSVVAEYSRSVVADEDRLPFGDASFDLIVSAASLHGVNDLPGALIQARRALKPGGVFLASLFGGTSLTELRRDLLDAESELTGRAAARVSPMVDSVAAAGLLQRAGFVDPVAEVDTLTVRYAGLFALLRDLRGMGEGNILTSRVPLRRDVLASAATRFAARAGADGKTAVTVQVLTLTGRGVG